MPWYAENRDLPDPAYGRTELYSSISNLELRFASEVRNADVVIVGSYVPEGVAVGEWFVQSRRMPVSESWVTVRSVGAASQDW